MKALKETKISELTEEQIESRKQYLLTLSDDDIIDYLLYILDNEYYSPHVAPSHEIDDKLNDKTFHFIADTRFSKFRWQILEKIEKDE